jgi:2-polyprenyl-6-methoxyphenol hydroxylase-like FAD-dependent oxidoreductase
MYNKIRIAIVGGGPGGLTLARILSTRGLPSTVLELDEHALARPQGGSLDLHVESGQRALREAGLEAELRRIARYEDQGIRLYDKQGALLFDEDDAGPSAQEADRPEVDRTALREILIASLPADTIRWGQKVRGVVANDDGSYSIDGASSEKFDVVVGADGAWSRVRPLLSSAQPSYLGVQFLELSIDDIDRRQPQLAKRLGRGKMFALGDGKGIIAQRNANAHVRIYVAFRVAEDWTANADLLSHFEGWAPSLTDFIARADEGVVARKLVALPIGHSWAPRAGLTLLGDAAHVMSPFTGEGVNIAMLDATELGLALASGAEWQAAVQAYERAMFERAREHAAMAAASLEVAFSPAAPQSFLELVQSIYDQAPSGA